MKAERINKNQVRFTLNRADLKARHIRITDLSYGSDQTKALFDDMIAQAVAEFGFDLAGHPVMIEAIPISEDSLMITMTQVNGQEDMISLFRSNIPGADMGPGEPDFRVQTAEEAPQNGPSEPSAPVETLVVYTFQSFDDLMDAARTVPPSLRLKNQLYHDEANASYYLVVRFLRQTRQLRYALTALTEYCADMTRDPLKVAYLQEHARLVMNTRALQKLSSLEQD